MKSEAVVEGHLGGVGEPGRHLTYMVKVTTVETDDAGGTVQRAVTAIVRLGAPVPGRLRIGRVAGSFGNMPRSSR